MAIHIRLEGNKTYVVADTVADWLDALPLRLPIRGPGIPEIPLLDDLPDFDTFDRVMTWSNKRYAEAVAEQNAKRTSSPRKDAAAGNSAVSQHRSTDNAAGKNERTDEFPPDGT